MKEMLERSQEKFEIKYTNYIADDGAKAFKIVLH